MNFKILSSVILGFILLSTISLSHRDTALFRILSKHIPLNTNDELKQLSVDLRKPDKFVENSSITINLKVLEALNQNPSSGLPYTAKGLKYLYQGDYEKAKTLLKVAQSRNPRSDNAAAYLFSIYLTQADYHLALEQLDILFRINPTRSKQYSEWVSGIFSLPDGKTAVYKSLKNQPKWAHRFILNEIQNPKNLTSTVELVIYWSKYYKIQKRFDFLSNNLAKKLRGTNNLQLLRKLKTRVIDNNHSKNTIIYNDNFLPQGISGELGWSYIPSSRTYAEPNVKGGLDVRYTGQKEVVLASQLFWLPVLEHNLLEVRYDINREFYDSIFKVKVSCYEPNKLILTINLTMTDQKNSDSLTNDAVSIASEEFENITECKAYNIELVASPSQFVRDAKVHIKSISITNIKN